MITRVNSVVIIFHYLIPISIRMLAHAIMQPFRGIVSSLDGLAKLYGRVVQRTPVSVSLLTLHLFFHGLGFLDAFAVLRC